ncbi:uncharacterized protein TRIVIDRAFT_63229 [Trichoderma virens Gv29-8]|uniref:NWD NACHT-NTPase N-terminal domain-containing protein n=1 Tax=Hypocrea virens (strain Gv29-8 / FGSC 10586) TaxID=413071 RepID=G9MEJ9_HYPVG|nr:uncharacterized protein TRIVIDRAFT_63229 [Trichoderma virens Gv29-8]EHK27478.1 hypothetical protein TRIVIDRAFT_63229 [Trichoderma virens Gv29-8]
MANRSTTAYSGQSLGGKNSESEEASRDDVIEARPSISHAIPSPILSSSSSLEPTQNSSSLPGSSLSSPEDNLRNTPIKELWFLAYERLKKEDFTLVKDYESKLQGNVPAALILPLSIKDNVREQMDEVTQNAWKLKFGDASIQMRDLLPPILTIISRANDYITTSLNTNMYASIGWASLFIHPSTQAESLSKGLERISSLLVQSRMREELYCRRYNFHDSTSGFEMLHDDYKNTLEALYREILRFQMASYCYYANNGAFRLGLDIVKWNDWDALLDKVLEKDQRFNQVSEIWRDMQYDEEYATAKSQHQEILQHWGTTKICISSLQQVI